MLKALPKVCAIAALTTPLLAQAPGGGRLPPEWKARLDQASAKVEGIRIENAGNAFHITTGPAGIFYPPSSQSGAYQVKATFTQMQPSAHPEAYGLFIGGADLQGPKQKYTYFLIRQDGKFMVKRRDGTLTKSVVDWTDSPAITKPDAAGTMSNSLSIDVGKEKVSFLVNDTEVTAQTPAQIDAKGLAGLRINHNLDVKVEGLVVSPEPAKSPKG